MKLLLVDLSHIFWSTWHATAGQPIDTAYQVTCDRVTRLRDGFDTMVVACDIGPSWRKQVFPEYKANRPERDPAAYDQLRRVREQLEADGWPVIAVENFEADDIIATLAARAAGHGYETTIASGDKDLLQIVGGPVVVQSTNPNGKLMREAEVIEKYGVPPGKLGDWLALVGDTSDNIKGAPGVGPKHAARLLTELGSLANMLEQPAGITPPGLRESITTNREQILLARRLVSLSFDVPVDFAEAIKPRERRSLPGKSDVPDDDETPEIGSDESSPPQQEVRQVGQTSPMSPVPKEHNRPMFQHSAPRQDVQQEVQPKESPVAATGPVTGNDSGPREVVESKPAGEGGGGTRDGASSAIVLDKQDPRWTLALEPRGMKQLYWYAERLHESQLYRKFNNADAIMAVIIRGRALGLDMTTSLDVMNVIKGKPCMGAMAIIGRVLASRLCEYFDPVESGPDFATWETKRVGRRLVRNTFTLKEATDAGLTLPSEKGEPSNWVKRPKPMLWKQAGVELARLVYPDLVANVYSSDEFGGSDE